MSSATPVVAVVVPCEGATAGWQKLPGEEGGWGDWQLAAVVEEGEEEHQE